MGWEEATLAGPSRQGQILDGRWKLLEPIGAGGMGTVHRAEDLETGRIRAVKIFLWGGTASARAIRRFEREYEVGRSLRHPGLVRIRAFGELPGEGAYIVMDFLPHATLEAEIRRRGSIPPALCRRWLREAAEALDHVHGRGLVHRDVKPANIMVAEEERVVVMDFGIIRPLDGTRLTATGEVMGTPLYTAPEVLRGGEATPGSDVYQLGVVAYEMLSGRPPFAGANVGRIFTRILMEEPAPLGKFVPGLNPGWVDLVARCMAKDPAARFPSARALVEALDGLEDPDPETAESLPAGARSRRIEVAEEPTVFLERPPAPSRIPVVVRVLPILLVVSALGLGWALRRGGPPPSSASGKGVAPVTEPRPVPTPAVETAADLDLRLDPRDGGAMRLSWRGREVQDWSLRVHEGRNRSRLLRARPLGGDRMAVDLCLLPQGVTELTLRGAGRSRSLATELALAMEPLAARLTAFDPRDLGCEICRRMTSGPAMALERLVRSTDGLREDGVVEARELARSRREALALERKIVETLRGGGWVAAHGRVAAWTPLLFSTRLLSLERRLRLFHLLMRFERLRLVGSFYQVELIDLPAPDFGDFAFACPSRPCPSWEERPLWRSEQGVLGIGALVPFQEGDGRRPFWRARFDLDTIAWERAELVFTFESFLDCTLRMTVNDRLVSHVWDRPLRPDVGHMVTVRHRLPPDLLRVGPNWVHLAFDGLFNHLSTPLHPPPSRRPSPGTGNRGAGRDARHLTGDARML